MAFKIIRLNRPCIIFCKW